MAVLSCTAAAWPAEPAPSDRLDQAVDRAAAFLRRQIGPAGSAAGEFAPDNPRFGGPTALCVYALLTAQTDTKDPAIVSAMEWLARQKLTGVYGVAMRACAYASCYQATGQANLIKPLENDMAWLIAAADRDGAYTYTSLAGKAGGAYDNSNSQVAILAISAASAALGADVPADFWRKIERHWVNQQQADGGWGYLIPPGAMRSKTYGSMTAAGLATLYVCFDNLHRDEFVRCTAASDYAPIDRAWKWLASHLDLADNPSNGVNWYLYWLFSLERVGMASGQKYIAARDWYAEGAAQLLAKQSDQGYWGYADSRLADTSFALMFLARGRRAVLIDKLDYGGKWNARPRDAAHFVEWLSYKFERHVAWQAVKLDSATAALGDAPIAYISGAGPCELSDAQVQKLRQFILQGGVLMSEAAANNAEFTLDIQKLHRRLFPQYPPQRVAKDHPLYNLNFHSTDVGLIAVSNGVRLLAIHSPRELSLGLQLGPAQANRASFELLGNICLYVTDKGIVAPHGSKDWPHTQPFEPVQTVRMARIKYGGNYDPEPAAWPRLAAMMARDHKIDLKLSEPMEPQKLDQVDWPAAAMTGTADFKLTPAEAAAIRKYIETGGTLIVDAAGGSKAFATAVQREILPLLDDGVEGDIVSDHAIFQGPAAVKISYRRDFAVTLGPARNQSRLRGVQTPGQRLAIIFSPDDLTAGLVGYNCYGIAGYSPDTAVSLMTNIVCFAANKPSVVSAEVVSDTPATATSQPAVIQLTQPATQPASRPDSAPVK